jgi:uncharacterized surface protein with fasciclin (FAS1) repeats
VKLNERFERIGIQRGKFALLILIKTSEGKMMKKIVLSVFVMVIAFCFGVSGVSAQMNKNTDIVDAAVNSKDLTTLVTAVKAAGLVDTLKSKGPFTVFAPTDSAFEKLPAGTVETLVKPENKVMLRKILTYHVVAGNVDSKAIAKAIKKGKGKATFKTVSGDNLTAMMEGNKVVLTDEKGGKSTVTIADLKQSNGVVHVIDTVVMPE